MDLDVLIGADPQPHPPGQVRQSAEGLPVDEIGPAADDLAQQQPHDAKIRQGPQFQLLAPGVEEGQQGPGDHRAVDSKASVPDGDHAAPVQAALRRAVEIQVKDDVVDPGAQHAAGHAPEDHVQHMVLLQAEAPRLLHAQQQAHEHGKCQNDPIPVDPVADMQGDGIGVELPASEEAGKADGHIL